MEVVVVFVVGVVLVWGEGGFLRVERVRSDVFEGCRRMRRGVWRG